MKMLPGKEEGVARRAVSLVAALGITAAGTYLFWGSSAGLALRGYEERADYNRNSGCLALIPGCGYCEGIVKGDKCYMKRGTNGN